MDTINFWIFRQNFSNTSSWATVIAVIYYKFTLLLLLTKHSQRIVKFIQNEESSSQRSYAWQQLIINSSTLKWFCGWVKFPLGTVLNTNHSQTKSLDLGIKIYFGNMISVIISRDIMAVVMVFSLPETLLAPNLSIIFSYKDGHSYCFVYYKESIAEIVV